MTSNERIILKCLWDAKGEAHICFISRTTGFNSDYARLLARSLERAGYLKFVDASVCYLLTRGRNHFQKNDELAPELSKVPQVILASSVQVLSGDGDDSYDKEDTEDEDKSGGQAVNDGDLDRALASISSLVSGKNEERKEKYEEGEIEKEEEKKQETQDKPAEKNETAVEEPAKASNGSGFSIKSIFRWFAEKKWPVF